MVNIHVPRLGIHPLVHRAHIQHIGTRQLRERYLEGPEAPAAAPRRQFRASCRKLRARVQAGIALSEVEQPVYRVLELHAAELVLRVVAATIVSASARGGGEEAYTSARRQFLPSSQLISTREMRRPPPAYAKPFIV